MSADDLLNRARSGIPELDLGRYTFAAVGGTTQARVWRGIASGSGPDIALRLTPKPVQLVRRIGRLVDQVASVTCPRTLAVGPTPPWTVHACTWIGTGPARARADLKALGAHLARLHAALAATNADFRDRPLSFEPGWELPSRYLWSEQVQACNDRLLSQPIHGDLHRGNIVATPDGFGFIDFDKVMHAPPVFDLAKLIATGMFRIGRRVRFQTRRTAELLGGYESVRPLSDAELTALEGLMILLNEETARLGKVYDIESYRLRAEAVESWWVARRQRHRRDPLGIRAARR